MIDANVLNQNELKQESVFLVRSYGMKDGITYTSDIDLGSINPERLIAFITESNTSTTATPVIGLWRVKYHHSKLSQAA